MTAANNKNVETVKEVETEDPDLAEMSEDEQKALEEEVATRKEVLAKDSPLKTALADSFQLRSIKEIEHDLGLEIPQRLLKTLKAGPARGAKFVNVITLHRFLSLYAPGWNMEITLVPDVLGVNAVATLSIPCKEGLVKRSGVGYRSLYEGKDSAGNPKPRGFGGAAIGASSQAEKRSGLKFGFARGLYID